MLHSAQEESAALLSQMFAQQLAGNPSYTHPAAEVGRAGPKQPPKVTFDSSKGQEGQGSEGTGAGGSRSSAPNPFEGLTGLPFQAQQETGQASPCASPNPTITAKP